MSAGIHELAGAARVLFTGREEGNLSSAGGAGHEHGLATRELLREQLGLRSLARGYQVHGDAVARVTSEPSADSACQPAVRADGQATALRGVGATVLVADCVPVALAAGGAVAMLHAGWRGLARGILEQGVDALGELAPGAEVHALVGPCAGACCYEVGEEVHEAFGGAHRHGRRLDLRAIAGERLLAAGAAHVGHDEACTICDESYFSHRREGARAGRQAGVAWLS